MWKHCSRVIAGLVLAIAALARGEGLDAWHVRAFSPVFDGLWPGVTRVVTNGICSRLIGRSQ
jgi:hypothetical protein